SANSILPCSRALMAIANARAASSFMRSASDISGIITRQVRSGAFGLSDKGDAVAYIQPPACPSPSLPQTAGSVSVVTTQVPVHPPQGSYAWDVRDRDFLLWAHAR